MQKFLELYQQLLGEDHPDVALIYNNLANLYESQGRYSEAEPLYKKALEIAELSLGVDHPSTTTIRENLNTCAIITLDASIVKDHKLSGGGARHV